MVGTRFLLLWPTALTIAGIVTDSFAPLGHVDCFAILGGEYPRGCDYDPSVECVVRGYDIEAKGK